MHFFYIKTKHRLYYKQRLACCLFFNLFILLGTHSLSGQTQLEGYLKEGIDHNESIKQQSFLLKKNIYALNEARALFFPSLSLEANYLSADGGRTIDLPIGDFLNPIYSTLNQMTSSNQFPQVNNISEPLNPDNYYDAKIRLSLPIINSEIYYNHKMQQSVYSMQELEIQIYKRELIKNIKIAYYQFCRESKAIQIRENGVKLANEGLRINESMYKNGMVNKSSVLRAENEVSKNEESLFSAQQSLKNSQAYFNFLLNKPFDSHIQISDLDTSNLEISDIYIEQLGEREELQKLHFANKLYTYEKKMAQSYFFPKVSAFLDLGSQGIDWEFNKNTSYHMIGVSLAWKFSLGGGDQYKVKKAKANLDIVKSQQNEAEQQLKLQLLTATNIYKDAVNSYYSTQKQLSTARIYYKDIENQYKESRSLYIELLDAQNQFINAELLSNIAYYNIKMKYAEKERANASFNLSNY